MIVTIDGPAGAGKSTVARRVARELGFPYLDSGAIYRAVTFRVLEAGGGFDDPELVRRIAEGLDLRLVPEDGDGVRVLLGQRDVTRELRSPEVTREIWRIAGVGEYRRLLVDLQRAFAKPHGVVCEGRDMGTVIFPDADCKVFLEASVEERARRRHRELVARGTEASLDDVRREILERDERDRRREHAPLRVPAGARVIDTDRRSADDVVRAVLEHARSRCGEEEDV